MCTITTNMQHKAGNPESDKTTGYHGFLPVVPGREPDHTASFPGPIHKNRRTVMPVGWKLILSTRNKS